MTFRLLILSDYPSPDRDVLGGIPRCVESTVSELSKLDPSIELFVSSFSSKVKNDVILKSDNLTIHYIPFLLTNYPIFVP